MHSFLDPILNYIHGDGLVILPQMELLLFALGILIFDFLLEQKEKHYNAYLALLGVAASALGLVMQYKKFSAGTGSPMGPTPLAGFRDSVIVDGFSLIFAVIFLAATALVILLSIRFLDIEEEQEGEYYVLILLACIGMMFMSSGMDLVVLFLGLETMALSFYVLTGFLRREKRSNEAALKYLLLGAFSTGILTYGFSLLYGLSGSTDLAKISGAMVQRTRIAEAVAASQQPGAAGEQIRQLFAAQFPEALHMDPFALQMLPLLAFVLVAAGMFFKIAAVPFHQWAPDVYQGAPTPISAYISVASKTASFAMFLRLLTSVFVSSQPTWIYVIGGVAIASLTWGNLAAMTQNNLKRLLAYSSISHVGYILLGIVAWNEIGIVGLFYYLIAYAFMTIGAFAIIVVLRQRGLIGDEIEDSGRPVPAQSRCRAPLAGVYAVASGHSAHGRVHGQVFHLPGADPVAPSRFGGAGGAVHRAGRLLLFSRHRACLAEEARRRCADSSDQQRATLRTDRDGVCNSCGGLVS